MSLSFLKKVTINDVAEKAPRTGGGVRKERNPSGKAIRLFKDGAIYPSQELVDADALEYAGKGVEHGYGYDIFDSEIYKGVTSPVRILWIAKVKKSEPKVDLFAAVGYHGADAIAPSKPGEPLISVLEQGAKTFGQTDLIPMVEEIYGVKFNSATVTGGVDFVDLEISKESVPASTTGVAFVPKKISRGEKKGELTVVRREKLVLHALTPVGWTGE